GVVAIEFGVVASLLIIMLVGATDLGMAMRHRSQMEGASRAGIQEALKGGTVSAVEDAVRASTDLPSSPAATVSAVKACYDAEGADIDCEEAAVASVYIEITVQQDHPWLLGFPGFSNPATLTIKNSVRVE
ncbi:MAG TPA: TadE/TadG family type IV pilus assembly protein, partial [Dongiaceae bacterium]|nr:TadE/TadG family type IV pilus assembly protein [Dongiaceae bacterium]